MTNLQARILTSVIYFPLLLVSVLHPLLFAWVMTFCLGMAWYEYTGLQPNSSLEGQRENVSRVAIGIIPTFVAAIGLSVFWGVAILILALQLRTIAGLLSRKPLAELMNGFGIESFGLIYLTLPFVLLVYTRNEFGPNPLWFLFLIVAAADCGCYFVGRAVGESPFFGQTAIHSKIQEISSNKTVEGFLGGIAFGSVAAVLFSILMHNWGISTPGLLSSFILGLVLSSFEVCGDLFESMLKRRCERKNSGWLLPGHGGILDRMDGLIFAIIPLFLYLFLAQSFG